LGNSIEVEKGTPVKEKNNVAAVSFLFDEGPRTGVDVGK
jgi:hypothetical protein